MPYSRDYDPLNSFIELFRDVTSVKDAGPPKAELPLDERLRAHVIDGDKEGLHECLEDAMRSYSPLDIVNDHLLEGMKTVGELFGSGKMQLPFVLQSAEVMKKAVAFLEPRMDRVEGQTKGVIVLATVKGDVHDIGKNLVDIILSNNGYTVHNIGIKQPISNIVQAYHDTKAHAIGLSGLLVKSVNVMEENLRELNQLGIEIPVILGGAALTRHYAEDYLRRVYDGPLLYGKDAFEGLRVMDHIAGGELGVIADEINERLTKRSQAERVIARANADKGTRQDKFEASKTGVLVETSTQRSDVAADVSVPTPPFWGSKVVTGLDLDKIYPFINRVALFRGQWQFKRGKLSDDEYNTLLEHEVIPTFDQLKAQCKDDGILDPKLVYGYWPCQSQGTELVIFDPEDHAREIERFRFPRQNGKKHLCIADFFRSVDSGEKDVLALHCVTMGSRVSEEAKRLFDTDRYKDYLYLHGMGVESAEALAEAWHQRIRQELGIAQEDSADAKELFRQHYTGSRYSPGYPACPDMSDQDIIWRLLEPERIGCVLTENYQIDPEQSTSAFIVHHPEAKYFNV